MKGSQGPLLFLVFFVGLLERASAQTACVAATFCSGHGTCLGQYETDGCQCNCGYEDYGGENCKRMAHTNAIYAKPQWDRFLAGNPYKLSLSGLPGPGEGHVSLVRQQSEDQYDCTGAGTATLNVFNPTTGTVKMAVDNTFKVTFPTGGDAIQEGSYTICFCNAEQSDSYPVHSNCDMDCAYHHKSQTIHVLPAPRIGPMADHGSVRVVQGVPATVRISSSSIALYSLKTGDYVFASDSGCGWPPPLSDGVSDIALQTLGALDNVYRSAVITLPTTLTYNNITNGGSVKTLKVCFWPQEFTNQPLDPTWMITELQDTISVITRPILCGGVNCRSFSGGAPNFDLAPDPASGSAGLDAGDMIYFRSTCSGIQTENHPHATKPLLVNDYLTSIPVIGCNFDTSRQRGEVTIKTTSMRESCGYVARDAHIGSQNAWCAESENGHDEADPVRFKYFMIQNEPNNIFPEFTQEYLEMDAGHLFRLWAIMTQGREGTEERVLTYAVSTSTDGVTWTELRDGNGNLNIYNGPNDDRTISYNIFDPTIIVRYVRIYPKTWNVHMSMRAGLTGCPTYATFQLPDSPRLTSVGGTTRELHACYATRRTAGDLAVEYTELAERLIIVPEPTDNRDDVMITKGEAWTIPLRIAGEAMAPKEGDFLWLKYGDCTGLLTAPVTLPSGPGSRLVLEADGAITSEMIFNARVNELNIGGYRLCFATKESKGDHDNDYAPLTSSLWLYEEHPRATLTVPHVASLGTDIVVSWSLSGIQSTGLDWIALFAKDACKQTDYTQNDPYPLDGSEAKRFAQNRCYLATRDIPKFETDGTLRFHQSDYKIAGEYEVRYFFGDSRNGQGWVCRGLGGLASGYEDSPTYKTCAMEAKATSNKIVVTMESQFQGSRKKTGGGAVHHLPGLEHARHAPIGI